MLSNTERKRIPILMYHSISDKSGPKFREFAVPVELFARQMEYLHQQAFTPITVSQLVRIWAKGEGSLPAKPVVLTFDDAFLDFYTAALPILQRYSFTATLYVPTVYVNGTSRWMQKTGEGSRPIVSWEQLRAISKSGVECGAHSHTHPQLDLLPLAAAKEEITLSKRLLEEHIDEEILSFAYPYGYHTSAIKQIVREAGFTSACAVRNALTTQDTDHFALNRVLVDPAAEIDAFAALLEGHDKRITTAMFTRALVPGWRLARFCLAQVQKPQQRERVQA